jgi:alpha/beta superfamily hydrolase
MRHSTIYTLLLAVLPLITNAQSNHNSDTYYAGYKTIHAVDKSRIYKSGSDPSHGLYFRPVDIDIWYPASRSTPDSVMIYKEFLNQFVTRPNFYRDTIARAGAINDMAKAFCDMNKCSDSTKLLYYKTVSFKNAKPARGRFPLVIYLASYGSYSFENYTLFEELSKQGFVVMAIQSIGRFPGEMTMKYDDVMQQVNDALFSLNYLSKFPNINFSKIGIVGYSWGGVAGSLLAGKIPNATCLVSLDGSEFHHYGSDKNEDADFDGIVNKTDFRNITVPYLRLEQSPPSASNAKKDSVYNFFEKLSQNNLILKVNNAEHYHFCCLPTVVNASGNCKDNGPYTTITQLTISYLNDHLKGADGFSGSLARELDKTVRKK